MMHNAEFTEGAAPCEPGWSIEETGLVDKAGVDRLGNKFLLGNGYIGYRGTLEEYGKAQKTATIVSGLYDKVGGAWREPVNLPNGGVIRLLCEGQELHALTARMVNQNQQLDMGRALHRRQTVFETRSGTHVTITTRRFVSLKRLALLCLECQISVDQECIVTVQSGIDADVWDLNGPHLENLALTEKDAILSAEATTHEKRVPVAVAEWSSLDATAKVFKTGKAILCETQIHVRPGQPYAFYKIAAHVTGLESQDPLAESRGICQEAAEASFEALLAEHEILWQERWAACNILIVGDPEAEQALRFSMYHLLAIAPTHAQNVSIPARGLSGQVYKGGIFWDTEIFMMPFFELAFPQIARNLLLYRVHTLPGARRKAAEYGFNGAFYAWESQDTGDDACTLFNVTDVFTDRPIRTYFRDKQVHISADVIYAFWKYAILTGDETIWRDGGAEVALECARFFLSYTYYNPTKDRYEVLDVTGPDEYHERVHNNAFTNWMVAQTLEVCLAVAGVLTAKFPAEYERVFGCDAAQEDLKRIDHVAQRLFRPSPEQGSGEAPRSWVISQFDGYLSLEDISLSDLLAKKLDPREYLGGGSGLATTTRILKQADVILGIYLFGDQFSTEIKKINWEFYEPRTEHGSSLSACTYSMIAAQVGKVDWAYRYFMKTATIDITGEGKQYVGPLYIGGTHPAANGGAWMAAVFGLCGVSFTGNTLHICPHLPVGWQQVEIPIQFRGQRLHLSLTHSQVAVSVEGSGYAGLLLEVGGTSRPLEPGCETVISLPEPVEEGER